jgi:hypothetical protein
MHARRALPKLSGNEGGRHTRVYADCKSRRIAKAVRQEGTRDLCRFGEPWHRIERLQHIVGWMDQWLMGRTNAVYATHQGGSGGKGRKAGTRVDMGRLPAKLTSVDRSRHFEYED